MSVGHCGNGCAPKALEHIRDGCRKNGCICAYVGYCRPWWLPVWLGKRLWWKSVGWGWRGKIPER